MLDTIDGILFNILMTNFFLHTLCSCVAPFVPRVAEKEGLSTGLIGLFFAVFPITILLFSSVTSSLSRSLSRRSLLIFGTILFTISGCLLAILPSLDKWAIFGTALTLRFFSGISTSLLGSVFLSIFVNSYPNDALVLAVLLQTLSTLGSLFGPLIGAAAFVIGGYEAVFLFTGLMALLFLGYPSCKMQNNKLNIPYKEKKLVCNGAVFMTGLSISLSGMLLSSLEPVLSLYLDSFDYSEEKVATFFVIAPAFSTLGVSIVWFLSNKVAPQAFVIMGLLISSLGMLLIGCEFFTSKDIGFIITGICLLGIGVCVTVNSANKEMEKVIVEMRYFRNQQESQDCVGSLNILFLLAGETLGPLISGIVTEKQSFDVSAMIFGFISLFYGVLFLVGYCFVKRQMTPVSQHEKLIEDETLAVN